MTATEKARRAESLYQDRAKRELADMVVHREADLEDLRNLVRDALACVRESSRGFQTHPKAYRDLRSRAKKLGGGRVSDVTAELAKEASDKAVEIARLKAENNRLRELVRDMWHEGMCECDERGACAECEYHFPDRMRELGVDE